MYGSGRSAVPARRVDEIGPAPDRFASITSSVFVVARAPRERMTIDLRGLAPMLKAHAKARHLTVSDAARLAVAAALETPPLDPEVERSGKPDAAADQSIKLTGPVAAGRCGAAHHTRPGLRPLPRHVPHHVDRRNADAAARGGGGPERVHGSARRHIGRPERGHPPVSRAAHAFRGGARRAHAKDRRGREKAPRSGVARRGRA